MVKTFFLFAISLFFSLPSQAFDFISGLTPPNKQRTMLGYSGLIHGSSAFPGGDAAVSFQTLDFITPLYKTEDEAVSLSLNSNQLSVRPTQSNLSELYDLRMGLTYTKALSETRLWSVQTRYGSASDRPFADSTVDTLGVTGFYSFSNDETSRWLLLVDYSNNRPILNNLPLPGFAYFYNPSKEFRGVFGAPFASINWSFTETLSLDLFTIVPWVLKGSVNYKINEFAKAYVGIDFSQVTYYLYGRENLKERLFYDEKKIFVGAKSPLSRSIFAELEIGQAFDRAVFVAENYKLKPDNPIGIDPAPYAKLGLRFLF